MIVKINLSGHKNEILESKGYIFPGVLNVDLRDPELPQKVCDFLSPLVNSGDTIHVVLPGLSPLASLVLVALHGLTGHFPLVVSLIKSESGDFVPNEGFDLQVYRNNVARNARKNIVQL